MHNIMLKETVNKTALADYITQLKKEYSDTLSGFNHEVRNYLTLLHSTAQLLEATQTELKENRYWRKICQDIEELILLLKGISNYNHSSNLTIAPTNLIEVISNVKDSFEAYASFQDVKIFFDTECRINNLPSQKTTSNISVNFLENFFCDASKVRQALCNILKNALEASNNGDTIEIHLEYDATADSISIVISNHGEQIDEDTISFLFNLYYTTKKEGNGLGLPICKRIMDAHNGTIRISSNDEKTSFSLIFPI